MGRRRRKERGNYIISQYKFRGFRKGKNRKGNI